MELEYRILGETVTEPKLGTRFSTEIDSESETETEELSVAVTIQVTRSFGVAVVVERSKTAPV